MADDDGGVLRGVPGMSGSIPSSRHCVGVGVVNGCHVKLETVTVIATDTMKKGVIKTD
jgi:hypothetical protein